jgi:DNA-binding MarR family transcriptional regulator
VSREPLGLPFDPIDRAGEIWESTFGPASAMRVATSVMRAQQLLLARFDEILKPHALTFARYEALVLLHFSRAGELPLSIIGQRLMVHPTSVTNTVDRLVVQGFVERRPNPRDGRGVLARLTAAGRKTVKRATDDLMADGFGLGMYDDAALRTMFDELRELRVASGDFTEEDIY